MHSKSFQTNRPLINRQRTNRLGSIFRIIYSHRKQSSDIEEHSCDRKLRETQLSLVKKQRSFLALKRERVSIIHPSEGKKRGIQWHFSSLAIFFQFPCTSSLWLAPNTWLFLICCRLPEFLGTGGMEFGNSSWKFQQKFEIKELSDIGSLKTVVLDWFSRDCGGREVLE